MKKYIATFLGLSIILLQFQPLKCVEVSITKVPQTSLIEKFKEKVPVHVRAASFGYLKILSGALVVASVFMLYREAHKKKKNRKLIVINSSVAVASTALCVLSTYIEDKSKLEALISSGKEYYKENAPKALEQLYKAGRWLGSWIPSSKK